MPHKLVSSLALISSNAKNYVAGEDCDLMHILPRESKLQAVSEKAGGQEERLHKLDLKVVLWAKKGENNSILHPTQSKRNTTNGSLLHNRELKEDGLQGLACGHCWLGLNMFICITASVVCSRKALTRDKQAKHSTMGLVNRKFVTEQQRVMNEVQHTALHPRSGERGRTLGGWMGLRVSQVGDLGLAVSVPLIPILRRDKKTFRSPSRCISERLEKKALAGKLGPLQDELCEITALTWCTKRDNACEHIYSGGGPAKLTSVHGQLVMQPRHTETKKKALDSLCKELQDTQEDLEASRLQEEQAAPLRVLALAGAEADGPEGPGKVFSRCSSQQHNSAVPDTKSLTIGYMGPCAIRFREPTHQSRDNDFPTLHLPLAEAQEKEKLHTEQGNPSPGREARLAIRRVGSTALWTLLCCP
ncbi:hypothetical protein H920_13669 [Fukomys damarensis]|uniref:Uncharacterized protein n=1 Tax=Fukomys damarensis TaxID=885580 RepID=A0A091D2X9_FUKDA|nr:hypothetical protein H920_13669 [Fukomys damarensis]